MPWCLALLAGLTWSCSSESPELASTAFGGSSGSSGAGTGGGVEPSQGAAGAPTAAGGGASTSGTSGSGASGSEGNVLPPEFLAGADAGSLAPASPDAGPAPLCRVGADPAALADAEVNIDLAAELQRISGFGGMDGGFYPELTREQVDTAFGNGPGQVGLSIMRIRVPEAQERFGTSVAAAARAVELGAAVMATPWTPPANMKSNNSTVRGSLNAASYGAYADHLLAFRDFMQSNGVPLYAISVQNEPSYDVDYESCDWTAPQMVDWIGQQGAKFGDTKLMAAEVFNFDHALTDSILNDPGAEPNVDIVAGHIYGGGAVDYPLAREKGKELWMTEHYTDSANPANDWPLALGVGADVHRMMVANFNAYVWWAIRRAYGLLTEDGLVSKRGYTIAQYAKFVRPGYTRVAATQPGTANVSVTAYKDGERVVVVALNQNDQPRDVTLDVYNGCVTAFSRVTTSATKSLADDGTLALADGRAIVTLDPQSITTFISQ